MNGAIHGNGTSRGWIYYNKQQVGTCRWIFNVRQVKGNHAPTVLIWGTRDRAFGGRSVIERWRSDFPDAELHTLPEANHFIQEDAPDEIAGHADIERPVAGAGHHVGEAVHA